MYIVGMNTVDIILWEWILLILTKFWKYEIMNSGTNNLIHTEIGLGSQVQILHSLAAVIEEWYSIMPLGNWEGAVIAMMLKSEHVPFLLTHALRWIEVVKVIWIIWPQTPWDSMRLRAFLTGFYQLSFNPAFSIGLHTYFGERGT